MIQRLLAICLLLLALASVLAPPGAATTVGGAATCDNPASDADEFQDDMIAYLLRQRIGTDAPGCQINTM